MLRGLAIAVALLFVACVTWGVFAGCLKQRKPPLLGYWLSQVVSIQECK